MLYNCFYALNLLISIVRKLANDGDHESPHCRDEELHFLTPVAEVAKNWLAQKLVVGLEFICWCNKSCINLESVSHVICYIFLDDFIQSRCQFVFNRSKCLSITLYIGQSECRSFKKDICIVRTSIAFSFDYVIYKLLKDFSQSCCKRH